MKYSNRGHFDPHYTNQSTHNPKQTRPTKSRPTKPQLHPKPSNYTNQVIITSRLSRQPQSLQQSQPQPQPQPQTQTTDILLASVTGTATKIHNTIEATIDHDWHLKYLGPDDAGGLTYLLGTQYLSVPYQNPVELGLLFPSHSSTEKENVLVPAVLPNEIFGRSLTLNAIKRCSTKWNDPASWYMLELGGNRTMKLMRYCMRGVGGSGDCLLNWELQGRKNDGKWVVLKSHIGDTSLLEISRSIDGHRWMNWLIDDVNARNVEVDAVRIRMTGKNTNGNDRLVMCGLELYGLLTDLDMPCKYRR